MLADDLERTKDQAVDELERWAAAGDCAETSMAGRRKRLRDLLEEAIEALRQGQVESKRPLVAPFADLTRDVHEHDLVRRYVVEGIGQQRFHASPEETATIIAWADRAEVVRLREQNDRLRALLDDVEESAALFAADGRVLYCNLPAFQRIRDDLGVPRMDVLGRTPAELGVPAELVIGQPIEKLLPLARAHERFEMSVSGRLKEGQYNAIYGPDGSIVGISLVVHDIHNRKLEQTRLSLLSKLSALVGILEYEELADALARVPIPELADWCAVNFIEHKRIQRSFVAQHDPSKILLRDAITRAMRAWQRHPLWQGMLTSGFQLLSEVSDDFVRRHALSDEHYRLFTELGIRSLMVVPLVARGEIAGVITLAYTDESGRRYGRDDPALAEELALHAAHTFENARLMKDLKSSEARFQIALAGAQTAVYEQDPSLRYVWYYNPVAGGDVVGKTHEEVFPPREAATLTATKQRVLEEERGVREEVDFTFGGEELRHYREAIEPRRDSAGRVIGVIGAATDITEQHRAQQQLTAELEFRERMMGILGHDLRNPLNTVIMTSDRLLRGPSRMADERQSILRVRRAAGRMHEMIDTLLDFTRARFTGRVPVSRAPIDLGEISGATIEEMKAVWPDNTIELEVHGDPRGDWDPDRMAQTIANLLTNAITYGEARNRVRVSIDDAGPDVDLKVHNQGPAIPPEVLRVIFEPFRRGVAEDRSPGGLGLGLYIVKEIVNAHDGTIAVDSTDRDGTTFTLHLPRHAVASAAAPA